MIPARRPWPQRDYAVIATLAVTGLRAADLRELDMADLEGSLAEQHLTVRHDSLQTSQRYLSTRPENLRRPIQSRPRELGLTGAGWATSN